MNRYRFELLLTLILFISGTWACGGSSPTPEPTVQDVVSPIESPTQDVNPISVWDMPGLPPTPTREPTPVIIYEHDDADLPEGPTELDLYLLESFWLGSLPSLSPDPTNAVADNLQAAQLGQKLFTGDDH